MTYRRHHEHQKLKDLRYNSSMIKYQSVVSRIICLIVFASFFIGNVDCKLPTQSFSCNTLSITAGSSWSQNKAGLSFERLGKGFRRNYSSLKKQAKGNKLSFESVIDGLNEDYENELSSVIRALVSDTKTYLGNLATPIKLVIAINGLIWLAWQYCPESVMAKHFIVVGSKSVFIRCYSWLTNAFSHKNFQHLMGNIFAFLTFGPSVHAVLGTKLFVGYILSSAFVASVVPAVVRFCLSTLPAPLKKLQFQADYGQSQFLSTGGFSGVNSALAVLYAASNPLIELPVTFFDAEIDSPVNSRKFLRRAIFFDLIGFLSNHLLGCKLDVAHSTHLVGYGWGFVVLELIYSGFFGKRIDKRMRSA